VKKMGKKKKAAKKKTLEKKAEKSRINPLYILGVILLLIILIPLIRGPSQNGGTPAPQTEIAGEYTYISGMTNTHEPGQVQMIVFFDFYCPHCYSFDTGVLKGLESKYGSQLEVSSIGYPIFGAKAIPPIRAYELSKDQGMDEEGKIAIFEAYHREDKDISSISVLAEVLSETGLDPVELKTALDGGAKDDNVQLNVKLAESYSLRQTPTVVLDGQYLVTDISQGNLETIINDLLA
jgi:thiol:disulfide interchange protein DsbA